MKPQRTWSLFRLTVGIWLSLGLCLAPRPLAAQQPAGTAVIAAVDVSAFPVIDTYLNVSGPDGRYLAGLPASAFSLLENNLPVSNLSAVEATAGAQIVFVFDAGPAFRARDANGVSRLEYIRRAFGQFSASQADDISILTPEGVLAAHNPDWGQLLADYQTDFAGAADPFPLLSQALDFASDAAPRLGMTRQIVFFSGGLPTSAPAGAVTDVATRALALGLRVHTVFVGPAGAEATAGAQSLQSIAAGTGGLAFVFSKPESLAPLFDQFAGQRLVYRLSYRSSLAVTGQHTLSASVSLTSGVVSTIAAVFPLRIEPPLVALPDAPATFGITPDLTPTLKIALQVDFPDGRTRALSSGELLLDGQPVARLLAEMPPVFKWTPVITASGVYRLQARVTDELGLSAESEPISLTINLASPAPKTAVNLAVTDLPPQTSVALPVGWISLAAAVAIGAAAGLGGWWYRRRRSAAPVKPAPVAGGAETRPAKPTRPAFHLPAIPPLSWSRARAVLVVVEPGGGGAPRPPVELTAAAVRLGRDGSQAEVVFNDTSVSRCHARIIEEPDGQYRIVDQNSTSGSWVNFNPVPPGGQILQAGDLINLGRVQLRFEPRDAGQRPASSASEDKKSPPGA